MRFRAISSLALSVAVSNIALGTILSGCSGGHTTAAPTPTPAATPTPVAPAAPVKVQTTIVWGQRSRQASTGTAVSIAGLSSSSSALITITGAQSGGGNVAYTANRTVSAAGGAQTYTSTTSAIPGTYLLTVQFYNLPLTSSGAVDPNAVVVGTAQANALIQNDGTISTTIATAGKIRSINILAGQQIALGQTADIQYSALGDPLVAGGSPVIIPVTAGVALVSVTNQTASSIVVASAVNGSVQALSPGKAIVTLTVDNVSSDATSANSVITVFSNASVAISPNTATVLSGGTLAFKASVANATTAQQGVVWSLAANSPAGGSIDPVTGVFTAPNQSGLTYTIIATSTYDPSKTSTATVAIKSNVVLTPTSGSTSVSVGANKTIALPVTVAGTSTTGLTYTEVKGTVQGTLDTNNNYTAPNAVGTDTVVVTSVADTAVSLTFTIAVGPSITIAPHTSTINTGQTVVYTSSVVGGSTGKVTYSTTGGSIKAGSGTSATFTPPSGSGVYTITATSVDFPALSDSATVTVQSGSGSITVQ